MIKKQIRWSGNIEGDFDKKNFFIKLHPKLLMAYFVVGFICGFLFYDFALRFGFVSLH